MNPNPPLSYGPIPTLFRSPLGPLGMLVLCLVSAPAQTVTFAGTQSVLPFTGLNLPNGVAVDSAGNVFVADLNNNDVVELPRTATGYGPQTVLPATLNFPAAVGVDSAGDVFIADTFNYRVVELPKTPTGFGAQTTLPFSSLDDPFGVAVDSMGDVFVVEFEKHKVWELPRTATGYGRQTLLPAVGLGKDLAVGVDSVGDVFIADGDNDRIVELSWAPTGFGTQIALPTSGLHDPDAVAVDGKGDVFIANEIGSAVVELAKTPASYALQKTLPFNGLYLPVGIAVDGLGHLFVVDEGNLNVLGNQTRSVNFGGANVCAPGATTPAPCSQTLTLRYKIHAEVTLGTPAVLTGGAPNLDFTLASGSTCTRSVKAFSSCLVNVTFAPTAAGFRNGSVEILDSSGAVLAATQLSGFGIAATTGAPVAQLSTNYLQFGTVAFGGTRSLALMVANIGGGTLTVAPSISADASGPSHSYSLAESTCAAGVTPGNSCTLVVEFSPTSIATHDDRLTLHTNGGDLTVGLAGSANGLSAKASLDFGPVPIGPRVQLPLTVTNVGLPGTVTVGPAITGHSYSIPTNTCLAGIAAGQSCTVWVEFAPTKSGVHEDLLTLSPPVPGSLRCG